MPHFHISSRGPLNAGRALLASVLALAAPGVADAGTYTVYSCQRPDASRAPADGWATDQGGDGVAVGCAADRSSTFLQLPSGTHADGAFAQWVWTGRPELPLRGFDIRRTAQVAESIGVGATRFRITAPDEGSIVVRVECTGGVCQDRAGAGSTHAVIQQATLTLEDAAPPRAASVSGSLTSSAPLSGSASLVYEATDFGSGVYRHWLRIDGRTQVEGIPDANGGRCRDAMPGWGTPYEFDYIVPCPPVVRGELRVDLTELASGPHRVEAGIEDAGGNRRTIHEGTIQVLKAAGLPAGRDATLSAWIGAGHRGRATSTYPHAPRVTVRVTGGGSPLSGVPVTVLERRIGSKAWRATSTLTTSASGEASVVPRRGPSRAIRFELAASATVVSSNTVRLDVRPRVRLALAAGRLSGRVDDAGAGVRVTLQSSTAGAGWVRFRQVRTTADGRFRATPRSAARARYRAVVPRQARLPFARGTSPTVRG
jgi:hypothetical protein